MKVQKVKPLIICILAVCLLFGCTANVESSSTFAADNILSDYISSQANIDINFSASDLDIGYDEDSSTKIMLADNNSTCSDSNVTIKNNTVTISGEGTYILSGSLSDGQIIVNTAETQKVHLVLNNVDIINSTGAAIYIKQADKVFITLAEQSTNILSDANSEYVQTDDNTVDAVVFAKCSLSVNGDGALNVNAGYKHGIVSKDNLVFAGGDIKVTSAASALYGKDSVKICGGNFTLTAGTNAIKASEDTDAVKGYVYINNGTFNITAQNDGIETETVLRIDDGTFNIISGNGSANLEYDSQDFAFNGNNSTLPQDMPDAVASASMQSDFQPNDMPVQGQGDNTATQSTESAKGLKSNSELIINGGTFIIDSYDDCLHCNNGYIKIAAANLTLASSDDGIHADSSLFIYSGRINITKSYEGLEANNIEISGGSISVNAQDDGINAAGGSDTGEGGTHAFEDMSTDDGSSITISGGDIYISAMGDGIDSNGDLYISNGTVYVDGPTNNGNGALDYSFVAQITGGTVAFAGSSGMAMGFSDSSEQCSVLYNFGTTITGGTQVTVTDDTQNIIFSYTPKKDFSSIVISSADLQQGSTYTISAASVSENITLNDICTAVNVTGGMLGGQNGNFNHGDMPNNNMPNRPGTKPDFGQNGDSSFVPPSES